MSAVIDTGLQINLLECYETAPKPLDYVIPGLVRGTVGSIVGPGGTSKSMFALQLAHCIGGGVDLLGFGSLPTGRVSYLSAEDGIDVLHERLHEIGSRLKAGQREACHAAITAVDLSSSAPDLFHPSAALEWVKHIESLATGRRLLIVDTLRSFHTGDENSGADMSLVVARLRGIAARTKCALLFIHHASKAAVLSEQGEMQQASRGHSVLTDNIRLQTFMLGLTSDAAKKLCVRGSSHPIGDEYRSYVAFGSAKQNYGEMKNGRWYRRGNGGVLEAVEVGKIEKPTKTENGIPRRVVSAHLRKA